MLFNSRRTAYGLGGPDAEKGMRRAGPLGETPGEKVHLSTLRSSRAAPASSPGRPPGQYAGLTRRPVPGPNVEVKRRAQHSSPEVTRPPLANTSTGVDRWRR
ncbi:hypothetical protein GCM10009757_15930 [Streptomyces cheonanensis]|uniref:Uncharacterized protein n=1 Tax=Streptomyces cheonanensis TaxID=312720 RepID=A0ABN2V1G8_9ACTN